MYHCHINFYLTGHQCRVFDIIKGMSPLEHFTHEFFESDKPDKTLTAKANVILADLHDVDVKENLQILISGKNKDTELILLAEKNQIELVADDLSEINDIWTMPVSDEEIKFRFLRWQQTYKMSKDYWQTSQYLESTINNNPNLIWYKDKDGIHEKVNDSFCKTVNKTKNQVEGRGHAYIWDVDHDDPACIESELEVMNKKKTCVSEETIKAGDGMKLLTTYKSPLYDLDGSVMGTVGVAIDITQERAYEQEIIKKNHTLETIFTNMDCGVIRHTVDGSRIYSINSAALKILGYETQEELMATGFDMIAQSVVDEDKEKLRQSIEKLKKEGDSISVEYRVQHADGEILDVMGNVKLLKENGELVYQRFLLDCTTQKQQEKKERMENEKRQMELVQALGIDYNLVCFLDLDTGIGSPIRLVDCENHVLGSIFNVSRSLKESIECYIQTCVYEEDKEIMRQATSDEWLKKELTENKVYHINYRTLCYSKMRYFQMKAVRAGEWKSSHGIVLGFRSVDEEIRDEMEKQSQLEEALLQANKANKAKSVFLSNMSHDIRTPMNAIVGFTNLAINHIDHKERVGEYLEKIKTSGNHLLNLINDVLDMSRIESGKIHLDEKPCSLQDIVHGLCNIVQADVDAKKLKLDIDTINVPDNEIYCDKLRLNQVLLNLLSNSVKYTEEGGTVSMWITEKSGAPEGYVNYEFHIKDTGIGMSKEFVSHIFEPFERERNSTISRIQGTGLGMSITKNIVDMMNGTVEVESEQGVGTEITVFFTFRLHSGEKKHQTIPELENCRALVVNSDINICESISYMLRQIGMRAEWTVSGEEAVQHTRQAIICNDEYGVYIIDSQLTDISGIEVTKRIREEKDGDMPVVVLTACDKSVIEKEAKEAGVTAFCGKPLFLSDIRNCLYSIINENEIKEKDISNETEKIDSGRILLAEDVELNQEIAEAILGEAGFKTEIAENGRIAVEMIKNSEPGYYQLILMDIQMPEMNGYEATMEIRKLEDEELASIPIIAMSANAFEEDRQEALKCGMNGHIAKPIDVENLFDTLSKVLT
ncbi:MAG: response regulator [Lachnospiraceae bacterium]|nr:response regulator [Lachnospiraceae bacterium]